MVSCPADAGDAGRDALHAGHLETESTHGGGVPRGHTRLPVHHGEGWRSDGERGGGGGRVERREGVEW